MNRPLALLTLTAALASTGCIGLSAGSAYPDFDSDETRKHLLSPANGKNPPISLGGFKFSDTGCEGIDTHTITKRLAQSDFTRFMQAQGAPVKQVKARGNLYWYDFPGDKPKEGDVVRLRLAVLKDSAEAAHELHQALLEHGPGWWGLRRANLSVLAPRASDSEAAGFAIKHKLMCWGTFMKTGTDDVYVVPGPYMDM